MLSNIVHPHDIDIDKDGSHKSIVHTCTEKIFHKVESNIESKWICQCIVFSNSTYMHPSCCSDKCLLVIF